MKQVFDALRRHAQDRPDALAFRSDARHIGWRDLGQAVACAAGGFAQGPRTVGLALDGVDYVIADLAATLAGCRVVPVPAFFSAQQVDHLLQDAGAVPIRALPHAAPLALTYRGGADRVIYTSGTTGRPKGVVIGDRQLAASIHGLGAALRPDATDRYLSVLPQAQLLEQICGIFLPVVAGAQVTISARGQAVLFSGDGLALAQAALQARPTITVLAPRQLALWTAAARGGAAMPDSLRFVAVGGAPVAPSLLAEARVRGIPAAQGYGLSEACSVVAISMGDPDPDAGMTMIEGISARICDGEIVVGGATVMQGYLNGPAQAGEWHTGDLGRIVGGRLHVLGRRDALILRSSGRKIGPEWVEAAALADPAILAAALVLAPDDQLVLVIVPALPPDLAALTARLADLPDYARPARLLIADPRSAGLIRAQGQADRAVARVLATQGQGQWINLPNTTKGEVSA